MSILKEIHEQPQWVRGALFALSSISALSLLGFVWITSFEHDVIVAMNPADGGQEQLAQARRDRPDPLAGVSRGLGTAAASIGKVMGFDREAGFDIARRNDDNQDRIYLLPLSE